ncbi:MAG: uL30 family ribosomal protein [Nanoarchaeota archaeon]|nr:uL30 family ribosomal protein [Nanoarchaeota archaeon]
MSKIAIVLIRGLVGVRHDIKETLIQLHLEKKHACVVKEDSPSLQGMLQKIRDFTTFGPVSEETVKALEKRKAKNGKVYFLAPPVGGFERKGIKQSFTVGGALGNRGEKINDLLAKMI